MSPIDVVNLIIFPIKDTCMFSGIEVHKAMARVPAACVCVVCVSVSTHYCTLKCFHVENTYINSTVIEKMTLLASCWLTCVLEHNVNTLLK